MSINCMRWCFKCLLIAVFGALTVAFIDIYAPINGAIEEALLRRIMIVGPQVSYTCCRSGFSNVLGMCRITTMQSLIRPPSMLLGDWSAPMAWWMCTERCTHTPDSTHGSI